MDESNATLTLSDGRARKALGNVPARPLLYVALNCDRPLAGAARYSLVDVDSVVIGRGAELSAARSADGSTRRLVIQIPDRWMSSTHAQLTRVLGRWVFEDANS